jgi:hypothetical protein
MIARARKLQQRRGIQQAAFQVDDVTQLEGLADGAFDAFTLAMGLHEMPPGVRARALPRLLEVASRGVIVDFAVPRPRNLAALRDHLVEVAAGRRHYASFRHYLRQGGLVPLAEAAGARVERQKLLGDGTLLQVELRRG